MDRFELIRLLMDKIDDYSERQSDPSNLNLDDFILHIKSEKSIDAYKNTFLQTNAYPASEKAHHKPNNLERVISQHLLFLYRYIKFYAKHIFVHSKIRTVEEFGMMMTVMQHQQISKSDLIKKNVMEKSSGIEIINRLIKSELLIQKQNPNDNRSQLIMLSEFGRIAIFQLFEKMDTLGKIATGELSEFEKHQMAELLKKLDHFHYENYHNKQLKELDDYLPHNYKDQLPS